MEHIHTCCLKGFSGTCVVVMGCFHLFFHVHVGRNIYTKIYELIKHSMCSLFTTDICICFTIFPCNEQDIEIQFFTALLLLLLLLLSLILIRISIARTIIIM